MLQILRKKAQSTFIQIIVVVIALVFIFWGVGANLNGDRQAALVINGEEVSFQDFQRSYDRAFQQLSDQFGGNVPKGLAETFGIKQQVVKQLIQTTLLRQGAREMGLMVSGEEIRKIIEEMVQFQDNGVFNIEKYKTILANNRMAPTKFEDSLRFDRLSEVAAREIGNFASVATDFEIQDIYSQQNEKVAVNFLKISPSHFVDQVAIDDSLLQEWFETVKDNYKTDPQIKLKYLAFTFKDVGSKIVVDSAKIEQYYQENLAQFKNPEKRHARHILFKAGKDDSEELHQQQAEKAEEIRQRAINGEDFATLAREFSEGPSGKSGGDLGAFPAGQMVAPFDQAVFAMQEGTISEIVKTDFGYHIILLEEIQPAATKSLEEVTSQITTTLQQKEAESLAFQLANNAYEGIIEAGSLAKYAETNPDATIQESDFFTKSDAPAELKRDSQFINKAFELNKGELSSLIKGQSGYAILFAEDYKAPETPSFESQKELLTEDYKLAKSKELAKESATKQLEELRGGKELSLIAEEIGGNVEQSGFVNPYQENSESSFPAALVENALLLSSTSPFPETPGQDGEDFFLYSYQDRQIPTMAEDDEQAEEYRQNMLRFKQQQLVSAWLSHLETEAEIVQNQNL